MLQISKSNTYAGQRGTRLVTLFSCFAAILCHRFGLCICFRIGVDVLSALSAVVGLGDRSGFVCRRTNWWEEVIVCLLWVSKRNAAIEGK
jgi:hypothetical protein